MATALIQLTQGGNVGAAGQALFGTTGTSVVISNNNNTGVASWQIDLLYVPPGSSLSVGTLASSNNGSTPSASFTPDVRGPYRIALYVWTSINRPGNPSDTDIRNFGIKELNGIYRPAPQIWPKPLPPTASGITGNKPDENNFAGQPNGWVGNGSDGLLDNALSRIDAAVQIAAGTQTGTSGPILFSNANGIAFGMNNSSRITASYTVPTQTVQTQNLIVAAAGTQTATSGTVVFADSNGLAFGMSGSSQITASYTVPSTAGLISAVNFSAGTTSTNAKSITFANGNNISFGINGATITGSVATSLTNVNLSAGTTSNNLSAFVLSNSNNVSFGLNGSTITASITVPAQTVQTIGLYGLGNTTQNSSTTLDARTLSLNGLGNITVGYSNGSIQISGSQTAQTQSNVQGISAGTQVGRTGDIAFSNSNGITFGMSGSNTVTASHNGLTVAIQSISAGTTQATNGQVVFSNSNGISFGMNAGTITATVNPGAAAGIAAAQAGTQTATSGTIVFSNSNGVSFGMSGSSQITASIATSLTNINLSAGTTSNNLSAVTFSNSNGISFGLNGSTVTASVATSLTNINISAGTTSNNLSALTFANSNGVTFGLNASTITASVPAQSNQTVGLYALGNTTQNSSTTLDARTLSLNGLGAATVGYSNGSIQISVPTQTAQTQSLIQAVYDGANSITTGTIRFTNANGVSFSVNGQTLSASVAAQSNQTVGLYALGNTTQNSSTTLDARTLSFNGLGAATVGYSNGSIQISVPNALTNVNISAGTTSNNLTNFVLSNSNNVSFGLNGSTVTATATFAQTNQTVGLYALGNTTQNSSTTLDARTLSFNGLGIITAGYSNGSIQLSATQSVQTQSNVQGISAGTQVGRTGDIVFSNSNGISFGMSGSNTITASYTVPSTAGLISAINVSAGTTSNNLSAITFSNSNGVSFGLNASTLTASVATSLTNINVSAGTTSGNISAVVFSNANGVSFGLNGSTVTGSVVQSNQTEGMYAIGNTTGQSSSSTFDARTMSVSGAGAVSVGYSGNALIISAAAGGQSVQTLGFYALGNTTQNSSTTFDARTISLNGLGALTVGYSNGSVQLSAPGSSSLSATGAFSISSNGSTISMGVPTRTINYLAFPETPWQTNFSISNASFSLQHFNPRADIVATQANMLMALSGNTNSSGALTISMGIYTYSVSTLSLVSSDSRQVSWTSGSQTSASSLYGGVSGTRYRTVPLASWAITAGDYMIGAWYRTTNDGTWRAFGIQGPTIVGAVDANETNIYLNGFSTSSFTTGMIASINLTATNFVRTGANAFQQPGMIFLGSF